MGKCYVLVLHFEFVLEKKDVDFVWLGRELLRNPYWVLKTAEVQKVDCVLPRQYRRAEPYSSLGMSL
ncbi:hypothetical protein WKT22_00933 [Candidatus Lokiarchaeum ossiferum]